MEKMTRRDFLKAAGTAAVGVAAYNLEGVRHGAGFVAAVEDFTEALWREYEACLQQAKES